MEHSSFEELPALLDLSTVEEAHRAEVWSATAPSLFPGLSVNHGLAGPPAGNIRCVEMGGGSLWTIRSSPALVSYLPPCSGERFFTLVMQINGLMRVDQRGCTCELGSRDLVLLDERLPFNLEGRSFGEIALLRMPREIALRRHPQLEQATAMPLREAVAGASLIGDTLGSAIHTAPFMQQNQRSAAMTGIMHLLGTVDVPSSGSTLGWRVQAALAFVELNFATPGLRAEDVARSQRISRRRLDHLMLDVLGVSITVHIWNRRLEQASADLRDPAAARRTIGEIAFSTGFGDPAHFTRAFRRRYGYSPQQWRNLTAESTH